MSQEQDIKLSQSEIEALVVKKEQELAERKKIEEFERRAVKAGVCPKCGSCDVYRKLYCNKSHISPCRTYLNGTQI